MILDSDAEKTSSDKVSSASVEGVRPRHSAELPLEV